MVVVRRGASCRGHAGASARLVTSPEPLGPVLAKIFILAFVILFIQKRPQGMFALKGRAAEVT